MSYPFVASYVNAGTARGPRLAVVWHMAAGGGTVNYLAKENPNGVSVHFVIEYTGRIVQMLHLDRMHTSIRTSAIRTSDDAPYDWRGTAIRYGATDRTAVMGKWGDIRSTLGPNHASIGVEMEGFAETGPNDKQKDAMARLWADLRSRYPGIRSLGHRDFASYKSCPGKKIPWEEVGGHGPVPQEDAMLLTNPTALTGTVKLLVSRGLWRVKDDTKTAALPVGTPFDALGSCTYHQESNDGKGWKGYLVSYKGELHVVPGGSTIARFDGYVAPAKSYEVVTTVGGKVVKGSVTLP